MYNYLDIQTFDAKLNRSKNLIIHNRQLASQLEVEKNQLQKRLQSLQEFNSQLKDKITQDEIKLLKNLKTNKVQSENFMNDEKELLNLRNQRIQLINENQIIDSDYQKNQLFCQEIVNQKLILKTKLDEYLSQIEYQTEIKKSLMEELYQVDYGLDDFQTSNQVLKKELNQVYKYIQNQTNDLFSIKDNKKREKSLA